jgi:hypothetical protein
MKQKVVLDAIKLGVANLVIVKVLQNVIPKYPTLQLLLSATIFHITSEYFKINDFYLEEPEYIDTSQ